MMFEDFRTQCREIIHISWGLSMLRLFLLVTSVMVASASHAGDVAPCSVDTVPIQVLHQIRDRENVLAWDWTSEPEALARLRVRIDREKRESESVTTLSTVKLSSDYEYPLLRTLVMAVTEHVAVRLAESKLCLTRPESRELSLLQFENLPLFAPGKNRALIPPLDAHPSDGCRISSPWIDFALERKPVPWVRAIVRWNARQLLADQALLAGAQNVPLGIAIPLTGRELGPSTREYMDTEIPRRHANILDRYGISHKDAEILRQQAAEAKPIEERVPPDLLWLFHRSSHSYHGFKILDAMDTVAKKGAKSYTELVFALIDRCFASDGADLHYNSIFDVADLVSLERYKIDMPILDLP